jgi:peptide/nickel transport system substrate-binding protein
MSTQQKSPGVTDETSITRRRLLQVGGAGLAAVGAAGLLAGCGGDSATAGGATGTGPAGGPKRGGTLRMGISGGGATDTFDAQDGALTTDYARILSTFEPLWAWDLNANVTPVLVDSSEYDAGAKVWTIKLKSGIEFHNGKPLTADDVIYSLRRVMTQHTFGYFSLALIDEPGLTKVDSLTVRIPMKSAYPKFPEYYASLYYNLMIVPVGYNPKVPIGTGPFKVASFTPGQASTMTRNPNYWGTSLPYVDTLVITDYSDETAQLNALASNQVDGVNQLSAASLPRLQQANARAVIADTGGFTPITMRVDQPPFDDVRVRQAFRLVVDRPQMLNVVFSGRGRIGNDIASIYDVEYDSSIPQRVQDIEQAKSLLKAAGREGVSVSLVTAPTFAGIVSEAEVFAQQASAAGIKVSVNQVTPAVQAGPNYLKWTFSQDYWYYNPYLPQVAQQTLPGGPYNETHWSDPHYGALYQQAFTTTDESLRTELAHEMQMIDHTSGGLIIPYFYPIIDGVTTTVGGVAPGRVGFSFGNFSFKDMWLT